MLSGNKIKISNRTLKFSLKRPVRTHHYQYPYIRLIMITFAITMVIVYVLTFKLIKTMLKLISK